MKRYFLLVVLAGFCLMAGAQIMKNNDGNLLFVLTRHISYSMIEEKLYENVNFTVELKVKNTGGENKDCLFDTENLSIMKDVEVTVKDDKTSELVYNKSYSQVYLYLLPSIRKNKDSQDSNVVTYLCIENSPLGWIVTIDENGIIF